MWIDGTKLADAMGTADVDVTTPSMLLTVGWHDVVVDVMKDSGPPNDGKLALTVAAVPEPSGEVPNPLTIGQPIPADHIRPVEGRGVRWAQTADTSATQINDGGTITRTQTLDLPANMMAIAIEQGVGFAHPVQAEVSLVLDPPVGGNLTLLPVGGATSAGPYFCTRPCRRATRAPRSPGTPPTTSPIRLSAT